MHPDLSIHVVAPSGTNRAAIENRVKRRAPWVFKQLDYFEQFLPAVPPRQYVGGETHRYLGRSYLLRVIRGNTCAVKISGRRLVVKVLKSARTSDVKRQLSQWYRNRAKRRFEDAVQAQLKRFGLAVSHLNRVQIRNMRTRWGSLSVSGILSLNVRLIEAPAVCIEYVIAHELCHLVHSRHDKAFYRLLATHMPDWKRRKERLERFF